MAPSARRRRLDMGGSKAKKKKKGVGRKTTVDDLPEHVVEDILFRLGPYSPSLVRAALAYRPWFRVVADAGFLARLGATTPHAGDYRTVDGRSLFVPSSPLLDAARFSLDFLPDSDSWELADSRGSLLLLSKKFVCQCRWPWHDDDGCSAYDVIVCDPLRKQYQEFRWTPDHEGSDRVGLFLLPDAGGGGHDVSMSSFRIVTLVQQTVVYVLTTGSSDGNWRMAMAGDEFPDDDPETVTPNFFAGRANGSLYWGLEEETTVPTLLVLDEATLVLSLARLPDTVWGLWPLCNQRTARVIGGCDDDDDGVLRVVRLTGKRLKVFARRRRRLGCEYEWVLEKRLCLSEATVGLLPDETSLFKQSFVIIRATAEYVLLSLSDATCVFTVELDTMRVERQHQRNSYAGKCYPYESPWPPVLSDLSKEKYVVMRRHWCIS